MPEASGRSMLGVQHDSRKASAPVFGFGSSDRNALAKVYISAEHNRADFGKLGPGAVYDVKSGFGAQDSSKNATPPAFSFGTASRFLKPSAARAKRNPQVPGPGAYAPETSIGKCVDSNKITEAAFGFGTSTRDHAAKVFLSAEQAKVFFGLESPGPAAYKVLSGVGAQTSSRNRTAPGYSIPKEQRLKYDYVERAKRLPGAGLYDRPGAVGPQVEATKATRPTVGFGTSTRDHAAKVFLGDEQAKVFYGMESPGPAALGPGAFGGTGRMVDSKKQTAAKFSFGTGARGGYGQNQNPGPGAYD